MSARTFLFRPALMAGCLLGLPGLALLACGGQTTPGESAEGKDASCAELCEKSAECNADVDVTDCTESCAENEVVSRSGQDLLTDCSTSLECEEVDNLETLACLEDGLFDLVPTQAQEDFCRITLDQLAECGGTPLGENDVDNCLSGVALLSEEFVTDLSECGERRTCDLVNLCAGLKLVTALDEDQLQAILGGDVSMGDLGGLGALEDLLGSLPDGTLPDEPPPAPATPDPESPAVGGAGPD